MGDLLKNLVIVVGIGEVFILFFLMIEFNSLKAFILRQILDVEKKLEQRLAELESKYGAQ